MLNEIPESNSSMTIILSVVNDILKVLYCCILLNSCKNFTN